MSSLTSFGLSIRDCQVAGMEWNWRSATSNLQVKKRSQSIKSWEYNRINKLLESHVSKGFTCCFVTVYEEWWRVPFWSCNASPRGHWSSGCRSGTSQSHLKGLQNYRTCAMQWKYSETWDWKSVIHCIYHHRTSYWTRNKIINSLSLSLCFFIG